MLQEVREIWRTTSVQGFEGQGGRFKLYTLFDREPMELFEKFCLSVICRHFGK